MHARLMGCLVLLVVAAQAQDEKKKPKAPGPFDAPPPGIQGWPGVRARYHEELQRCNARLERNAADADALERAYGLCSDLGYEVRLVETARAAVKAGNEDEAAHLLNRGILGLALLAQSNTMGNRGMVFFINGRRQPTQAASPEQKKLLTEATDHLRAAIKKDRKRPELRFALADALVALQADPETENVEADQLRDEAESITIREAGVDTPPGPYAKEAEKLLAQAMLAEQKSENPDHAAALELRKKALVLAFCRDTIVFDFSPTLYEPVSMLAPRDVVFDALTRTFQNKAGEMEEVAPNYHAASVTKKLGLIEALGKEQSAGADAVLLALVRGARSPYDPVADAAAQVLAGTGHEAARRGLPLLLAKALGALEQNRFPLQGQRRLVDLAAAMGDVDAGGVLAVALPKDTDLQWPKEVARALGKVGKPEHADALLKIALDGSRALHFRRAAARAFGRLAFDRIGELASRPELELAIAAARYEKAPDESTLGLLLNAFGNDLDVDDAARYCAELRIAAAVPAMDTFLRKYDDKRDHPARLDVERARQQLNAGD